MSRATRDAAAAAEIRFAADAKIPYLQHTYATRRSSGNFARRNADRVTSLGSFEAPNIASIRMYSQLRDLKLKLDPKRESAALLPCSLTKLVVSLRTWSIDWDNFRRLCYLQELRIYNQDEMAGFGVLLDDSFAIALPLLRVFYVSPGVYNRRNTALKTTAKVVMPHLVELYLNTVNLGHLDLHFMSALKRLWLYNCTASTVSAACKTMETINCWMREGTVLVTPNLRSLTIFGGGLHKLDGSRCRHALSIVCKHSSIEWVGAEPNIE